MPVFQKHEADLISELVANDVKFAVIGGAAVVLHGYEREREDLDLLLSPNPENIDKLTGVDLNWLRFKQKHIEALKQPNARLDRQHEMHPDILTVMKGVATDDVMKDRVYIEADGIGVPVISKEHLIEAKRAAGDQKDLDDIAALS